MKCISMHGKEKMLYVLHLSQMNEYVPDVHSDKFRANSSSNWRSAWGKKEEENTIKTNRQKYQNSRKYSSPTTMNDGLE